MGKKFRTFNPVGKIPVVVDGSQVVFESGAALQWLADRYERSGEWAPLPQKEEWTRYPGWMYFAADILLCVVDGLACEMLAGYSP